MTCLKPGLNEWGRLLLVGRRHISSLGEGHTPRFLGWAYSSRVSKPEGASPGNVLVLR